MEYHVGRNGTQLGIFNDDQLREGIANRSLQLTDLVWCEGLDDWAPLSEIIEIDEAEASEASASTEAIEAESAAVVTSDVAADSPATSPAELGPAANEMPQPPAVPAVQAALPPPHIPAPAAQPVFTGAATSGTAIASFVCGILGFFCVGITSLPAIICGHIALGKINRSNGMIGGKGMAIAGLVMGYMLGLLFILAMLAGLALPAFTSVQEKSKIVQASSNARQIIIGLRMYAADNNGMYPDSDKAEPPQTSNAAFRLLIKGQHIQDERVFTAPGSPFKGDDNIGEAPEYKEALEAGENHWAMTQGLSDSAPGNLPLIFENPNASTWPPTWSADANGNPMPGRAWRSGKIIIGMNDASVEAFKLEASSGAEVKVAPRPNGTPIFDAADPHGILMPAQ